MPGVLDVKYEHDKLRRLTRAQEGSGTISAVRGGYEMTIDTTLRDDRWTDPSGGGLNLSQTGNWVNRWFSESGETSATAAGTTKVAGTFSDANEQTKRVRTPNGGSAGPDLVPTYNARGDMTDDGVKYTYQYDAWGRMTKASERIGSPAPVAANYRYNGLGYRIGWQIDVTVSSGVVDGTANWRDPWCFVHYNEKWQQVAVWRATTTSENSGVWSLDNNPKETFIHHAAGVDGRGGSSYFDAVVCRH